ncbi:hypothetical protein [Faecalibacillus faecis]|uniref:hypothetical protein n=1 Tax=Faecalibacillus faecis TaxID=1982628 RepID=UPI0012D75683|nr:hypothetical protein [Faecalibacillus faecis]
MKRRKVSFKDLIKKFICKAEKVIKVKEGKVDFQKFLFFLYKKVGTTASCEVITHESH